MFRDRSGYESTVSIDVRTAPDGRSCDDVSARWRAEIIADFRLRGAERCAAASPTPGFPQILDALVPSISEAHAGTWLEIGGGLGGVASWLARTLGVDVVNLDADHTTLLAGHRLFVEVPGVVGTVGRLPIRSSSVPVVLVCGVVSRLTELDLLFSEIRRVCRPDAFVIVTDLWSDCSETWNAGPNTFWSIEALRGVGDRFGFEHVYHAIGDASVGWWSDAAKQVNDEIPHRYGDRAGFESWRKSIEHVEATLNAGAVVAAGFVMRCEPIRSGHDLGRPRGPDVADGAATHHTITDAGDGSGLTTQRDAREMVGSWERGTDVDQT